MSTTIKVQLSDDIGTREVEVEPTFEAIARLMNTRLERLTITVHKFDTLVINGPLGDYVLVKHEDFKKIL